MEIRKRRLTHSGSRPSSASTEETHKEGSSTQTRLRALLVLLLSLLGLFASLLYTARGPTNVSQLNASIPASSSSSRANASLETQHCILTNVDAIRALRRAKSDTCREQISLIACRSQNGSLYSPEDLPNHCPNRVDKELHGKHLGCFSDSVSQRLLPDKLFKFKEDNSPAKCISACSFYGFLYAGLQFRKECFCGNAAPSLVGNSHRKSECDLPCPKPEDGICGGYLSMNVYHTGVVLAKPIAPQEGAESGKPVRIVFLLTLSGRSLRQVKRLLQRIYSHEHYYFIHIDSRVKYLHRELSVLQSHNVKLVPKRFATIWGGSSLLEMLLYSMETLVEDTSSWEWDFILNLSESDYPLKPLEALTAFLSRNRGKNFVKSHGRDSSVFIQKQGLERTFFECENRMWRIGNRKLPKNVTLDGGSDWICLHRDFVMYLIRNMKTDTQLSSLRLFYNYTLLPAESFFHTSLRNSKYCSTYVNNNLHLTNWKRKLGCKCQHKAVVDWCGCSPNDITPMDWSRIKATVDKDIYFVRKVEPVVSQTILDLIDSELLGLNEPNDDRYWQSIWHHLDEESSISPEQHLAESLLHSLGSVALREITSFHRNDSLRGVLVLFTTAQEEETLKEAFFIPKALYQEFEMEGGETWVRVEIGSAFDPKELIFRNFFKAFGPEKSLGVKLSYRSSKSRGLSLLWVDPGGSLVKSVSSQLNATAPSDSSTLVQYEELGIPDMPGLWRVIPIVDGKVQRGIAFLVNSGEFTQQNVRPKSSFKLSELMPLSFPKDTLQKEFSQQRNKSLLKEFYLMEDSCVGLLGCSATEWSSLVHDPKSLFPS